LNHEENKIGKAMKAPLRIWGRLFCSQTSVIWKCTSSSTAYRTSASAYCWGCTTFSPSSCSKKNSN